MQEQLPNNEQLLTNLAKEIESVIKHLRYCHDQIDFGLEAWSRLIAIQGGAEALPDEFEGIQERRKLVNSGMNTRLAEGKPHLALAQPFLTQSTQDGLERLGSVGKHRCDPIVKRNTLFTRTRDGTTSAHG